MKKKVIAVFCALTLMFGMSLTAMAEVSPSGTQDTTDTTNTTSKAPETGEANLLIYGVAAAALLSGAAVISRKRLEALK